MKIITNNKWKNFKYRNEVPEKVLKNQFEYLSEDEGYDGFFQYRKNWYHLSEFMRIGENSSFPKTWEGYSSDSFFSGILIRVSHDGEWYQVGTYVS